jgi:hypothetical protein
MNTYKPKKLINGYKIGTQFGGQQLIALPEKKVNASCEVTYSGGIMRIDRNTPFLHKLQFTDKFGRKEKYWLYYYVWKPDEQEKLF